jgi:hypothetical protein
MAQGQNTYQRSLGKDLVDSPLYSLGTKACRLVARGTVSPERRVLDSTEQEERQAQSKRRQYQDAPARRRPLGRRLLVGGQLLIHLGGFCQQ